MLSVRKPPRSGPITLRDAEDGSEEALVLGALGGREDVGNDGKGHRGQRGGPEPLQAPEDDQLHHAAAEEVAEPRLTGHAAQGRADQKDDDAEQENRLAAVDVRELAVDRHHGGAGQQVSGGDPRVKVEAVEVGDDARQRGGDDGLVQRRQKQAQQGADQNEDLGAVRQDLGVIDAVFESGGGGGWGGLGHTLSWAGLGWAGPGWAGLGWALLAWTLLDSAVGRA